MIFPSLPYLEQRVSELPQAYVRRYFPQDLYVRLGLHEGQITYFGLQCDARTKEGPEGVLRDRYLVALGRELPPPLTSLSFANSKNKWIRGEWDDFMRDRYRILKEQTPLLLLRLDSRIHMPEHAFRFSELLRYADHDALRGRGIATAVTSSLRAQLHKEGTEFLSIFPLRCRWPSYTKAVANGWIPRKIRAQIEACIHPDYPKKWWPESIIYLTDAAAHDRLYRNAQRRKAAWVKRHAHPHA